MSSLMAAPASKAFGEQRKNTAARSVLILAVLYGSARRADAADSRGRAGGKRKRSFFALLLPMWSVYLLHNPPACRGLKGRTGENLSAFCFFE
jgi:hypothetical protein